MRPLTTLLYALAVCGILLAAIGYAIGPVRPDAGATGLTAATVLATDGMGPHGEIGDDAVDVRPVPDGAGGTRRAAASGATQPAG